MQSISKKTRKYITILAITILVLTSMLFLIVPPLSKYLVEKYDVALLGREIKVGRIFINPFNGLVSIKQLEIFELKKDTVFFAAKQVDANFTIYKLFAQEYEITDLIVEEPLGYIIQKNAYLNFSDLIHRFTTPGNLSKSNSRARVSVLNFKIINGKFNYREKIIPIDYTIHHVNIEGSGIHWKTDTISAHYSFESAHRTGNIEGNFTINTKTQDYRLSTQVQKFDLELIRQYLWELINYGMFRAQLEANITVAGNFNNINDVTLKGRLAIEDFHLGKTVTEDYISFERLALVIDELSPVHKKYLFDSVTIDNPFVHFERFDSLDNAQAMFGKKASNISDVTNQPGRFNLVIQISRYIETLSKRFFASQYRVNSLAINNGDINFSDYSLSQKFSVRANQLFLKADSISKTNKRVKFVLKAAIYPYGAASATLSMNPLDSGDIDLLYSIEKVPVTIFNPYITSYTSFPLDKGVIELSGDWKVRKGLIQSMNHLVLVDPRIGARLKLKELKWLPLPIIMAFVRERGNIIDYKIPISGNLKDPKFHMSDLVLDLVENIFVKPPTVPFGIEVKTVEKTIESSIAVTWKVGQSSLDRNQIRFINTIARFLKENNSAVIDVYPEHYDEKEKEQILFYETRKKYFLLTHNLQKGEFSKTDSVEASKIDLKSIKEYLVKDLTKITRDTTMFTIHDRCNHFLANGIVEESYLKLIEDRTNSLHSAFQMKGVEKQVRIRPDQYSVPHDGFSNFRIVYNGSIPESLSRSYERLFNLNKSWSRQKYFKTASLHE